MKGFYEESPWRRRQRLKQEKAATNPFKVVVGQVYRGWDPRYRNEPDDTQTKYKVVEIRSAYAVCAATWPNGKVRRGSIRLDRFSPKNYKLLSEPF